MKLMSNKQDKFIKAYVNYNKQFKKKYLPEETIIFSGYEKDVNFASFEQLSINIANFIKKYKNKNKNIFIEPLVNGCFDESNGEFSTLEFHFYIYEEETAYDYDIRIQKEELAAEKEWKRKLKAENKADETDRKLYERLKAKFEPQNLVNK